MISDLELDVRLPINIKLKLKMERSTLTPLKRFENTAKTSAALDALSAQKAQALNDLSLIKDV
jgi:hypothetical protein